MIEKNSIFYEVLESHRLLEFLFEEMEPKSRDPLYQAILSFLEQYAAFHQLSAAQIAAHYLNFIKSYNQDLKQFTQSGAYPLELNPDPKEPDRVAYNIILIMSILLTEHRFRIMELIKEQTDPAESAAFIGCGPGVELVLVNDSFQDINAFDMNLDPFLISHFSSGKFNFQETYFTGDQGERVNCFYLIELLEHLDDPYLLLQNCKKKLKNNGNILLTTATNLPQFDHRYNFPKDHIEFEHKIKDMGFGIIFKESIVHNSVTMDVGAMNTFYKISQT